MDKNTKRQPAAKRQPFVRLALALGLSLIMGASPWLVACGNNSTGDSPSGVGQNGGPNGSGGPVEVRVASLKGPTSIGLVTLMNQAETGTIDASYGRYGFTVYGTADEIMPQMVSGDIDIALLPANLASVLYARTDGMVTVININTLGVLYVVSADSSINSLDDLAGRTLQMTGRGTTPEYVMNYLLANAGLTGQVTLEYKSEATELAAALAADPTAIALLPEPYVTVVCSNNPDLAPRISLTTEWRQAHQGGQLVTGVTVVRSEFLAEHPEVIEEFLGLHAKSVDAAYDQPAEVAALVVKYGIIDNAEIAERAIPNCYLVCLTGDEMSLALGIYLDVLYAADPDSVGGRLPGDDFYYQTPPPEPETD